MGCIPCAGNLRGALRQESSEKCAQESRPKSSCPVVDMLGADEGDEDEEEEVDA